MKMLGTWKATSEMVRYSPRHFSAQAALYVFGLCSRVLPGLALKAVFDRLTGSSGARLGIWSLFALFVAANLSRIVSDYSRVYSEETFRSDLWGLLRRNILRNVLRRPGALAQPTSTGDAISRLGGDVMELSDWPTWLGYLAGNVLSALVSLGIMFSIDSTITLVVIVPLVLVVVIVQIGRARMLRYYHAGRDATGTAVSFLGEALASVQAIKVADAETNVAARLRHLNDLRLGAEVKSRMLLEIERWASGNIAGLGRGVVLLLAGQAMRRAAPDSAVFTVGDLALFVSYMGYVFDLPATLGGFLADFQTQEVSIQRMLELQPDAPPESLVAHGEALHSDAPGHQQVAARRLDTLRAVGMTYRHPGSGRGIDAIDLALVRGSFTVVTGRIGSGKTTFMRCLLGLLPLDEGELYWNGERVVAPADFFRPPNSAYVPQVPSLFSESLRDNILMGLSEDQVDLQRAVRAAVLERDVAGLVDGLATIVGPRGVRLSGGQVQRTAAARMFVRVPEILAVDDLSSALDVETERLLWERLSQWSESGDSPTCIVASHRRAALQRADRILVLVDGRLEAEGTLHDLLKTCPELCAIWAEDVPEEARQ